MNKMGNLSKVILSAIMLTIFSASWSVAAGVKIMPVGDSITRGYIGSAGHWGYRQPLYVHLMNGSYSFDFVGIKVDGSFPDPQHEGRDGWRADEVLNGRTSQPTEGKLEDWLNTNEPNIVLLHIGTNDITAGNLLQKLILHGVN